MSEYEKIIKAIKEEISHQIYWKWLYENEIEDLKTREDLSIEEQWGAVEEIKSNICICNHNLNNIKNILITNDIRLYDERGREYV